MVGIDVAKNTVVATVLDASYQILVLPVTLDNTDVAVLQWLQEQQERYPGLAVCCESTGYYHYTIIRACAESGIDCQVLNPIVTKQATKATIRGKKTDASDSILIAQLGLRGDGVITSEVANDAKVLLRVSDKLQATAQGLQLLKRSLIERHVSLPPDLDERYQNCLEMLAALVVDCRAAVIAMTPQALLDLLTSIPGIGPKTAAVLVAEIGDITRFSSAERLIAYTGLDPRVRQSGKSLHRNTRLTKRGSPSLRRAIFMSANVTRQFDSQVKAYYQRKRQEGRTHTEAMIPTCRRLLTRIYAIWRNERPYVRRDS
jgi:transposase